MSWWQGQRLGNTSFVSLSSRSADWVAMAIICLCSCSTCPWRSTEKVWIASLGCLVGSTCPSPSHH